MNARRFSTPGSPRWALAVLSAGLLSHGAWAHVHGNVSAVAELQAKSGSQVAGTLELHDMPGQGVHIGGRISGLTPGRHGIHVHVNGNCDAADAMSAGGHFSPVGGRHGNPDGADHHLGDLGNIVANAQGVADVDLMARGVTLTLMGPNSIAERSIVIHAGEDDFSEPAGNSGARVACGYIDLIELHMRM